MRSFQLPARFKGGRDYIHGTDLFDAAQAVITDVTQQPAPNFEIAFNAMATKGVTLLLDAPAQAKPCGTGVYWEGAEKRKFWLVVDERGVDDLVPYPEELVTTSMDIDGETATATVAPDVAFSNIEIWVPMIKALHVHLFPEAEGKWVFVRAQLKNYTPERGTGQFEVALASRVGQKITRNEVSLDGQKVGDIFFMQM